VIICIATILKYTDVLLTNETFIENNHLQLIICRNQIFHKQKQCPKQKHIKGNKFCTFQHYTLFTDVVKTIGIDQLQIRTCLVQSSLIHEVMCCNVHALLQYILSFDFYKFSGMCVCRQAGQDT